MNKPDTSRIRAITLLACAAFASAASLRACDPLVSQLAKDFGTSTGQAAQVISAFSVAYGLLQALYGPLGDRYGKYYLVALATLGSTVGTVGAAFAESLGWLILCRALAGAIAAAIIPLSMAWIGDTVPYDRRQATLARFLSGQILGLIGGQFMGGLLADTLGWRWTFIVLAGIYVVVGVLLLAEVKRNALTGNWARTGSNPVTAHFLTQVLGVLRVPWARAVLVTVFLEGTALFGALAFIPSYLHGRFQVSLTGAGAILAAFGLGGLSYTFIARRFVATLGERGLARSGGFLLGAAFALLLFSHAWFWALPACIIAGLGFYMLHNTLQTNATQMAPNARGTAVSLFACAYFLGQSAGVALGASVIDVASTSWLFATAAVLLPIIGLGFAYALHHRQLRRPSPCQKG